MKDGVGGAVTLRVHDGVSDSDEDDESDDDEDALLVTDSVTTDEIVDE